MANGAGRDRRAGAERRWRSDQTLRAVDRLNEGARMEEIKTIGTIRE